MYSMHAEPIATDTGTLQIWHALDPDGIALCGRTLSSKITTAPDSRGDREEYCTPCMQAVTSGMALRVTQASLAPRSQ
jgi:hypothetical protein